MWQSSPNNLIRFLTADDAEAYQRLRLESLQQNPNAFLSLYETESLLSTALFAAHLRNAYHPPFFGYLGAFVDGQLVAYLQVSDTTFEKQRHIAQIYNLYITPTYRKQGLAKALFNHVFALLAQTAGRFEQVYLSCTASNAAAYRLYRQLGFQRYAVRKRAIKWQGVYDDEVEMVKVL